MKSYVDFDEILEAFLKSEGENYFFISENLLIQTSKVTKEIIQELKDKGFTPLPHRSKEFDFKVKESFVYEITDQKIAEKFFEAVIHKTPKKSFDELIIETNIADSWILYQKKVFSDTLINWMVKNNVNLPDQILIPTIDISVADKKSIPDEMLALIPKSCNNCKNTEGLYPLYFKTNLSIDNTLMENEIKKILSKKGIAQYEFLGETKKDLISACKCSKCESSDIHWDFR